MKSFKSFIIEAQTPDVKRCPHCKKKADYWQPAEDRYSCPKGHEWKADDIINAKKRK